MKRDDLSARWWCNECEEAYTHAEMLAGLPDDAPPDAEAKCPMCCGAVVLA